jgi:hypothetical protein
LFAASVDTVGDAVTVILVVENAPAPSLFTMVEATLEEVAAFARVVAVATFEEL